MIDIADRLGCFTEWFRMTGERINPCKAWLKGYTLLCVQEQRNLVPGGII